MTKIKMKVVSIREEPGRNGGMHLRIKVKSGENLYTFAVKEEDYLDENKRAGFHQNWIRTIRKAQTRAEKTKKDITKEKEKVRSLIGVEVEEDEYY
jgi:hypothetical protein